MPLEFPVTPMKAVLGTLPADDVNWAFEIKWDGFRALGFVDDGALRLQSSTGRDITGKFPELAGLPGSVNATTAILDGELVALDDDGRPRFELVARRDRPVVFHVFDVLRLEEHDTIGLAYTDRRRLLEGLLERGEAWLVPDAQRGDGAALAAATDEHGLEGVIAKRLTSTYHPGARSRDWIKIKHRRRVEVVIGGYTAGEGNRASSFGALLVGVPEPDGLRFAGGVGTGFDQATLSRLRARLDGFRSATCPFRELPPPVYRRSATWVEPVLTAEVEIAEFTNDGIVRHASFVRLTGAV